MCQSISQRFKWILISCSTTESILFMSIFKLVLLSSCSLFFISEKSCISSSSSFTSASVKIFWSRLLFSFSKKTCLYLILEFYSNNIIWDNDVCEKGNNIILDNLAYRIDNLTSINFDWIQDQFFYHSFRLKLRK